MARITGGCFCGAIRYAFSGEPLLAANCHCRDCQRTTGCGHAPIIVVQKDATSITGSPTWFDFVADSGKINRRGFCPTCGTSLFSLLEAMPDVLGIKAGTMDEPAQYQPAMDIFTASAQPWDAMSPKLPKFERMPAM
jgi:hypothetical protein